MIRRSLIFAVLFLSACQSTVERPTPTYSVTNALEIPLLTEPALVVQSTPTIEATPFPSPTSLPNGDNLKDIMTRFVQVNGDCELPCLLGLRPGISDRAAVASFTHYFQDHAMSAENQMNALGLSSDHLVGNKEDGGASIIFLENQTRVMVSIDAYLRDDIVNHIEFSASVFREEPGASIQLESHPYFDQLLSHLSLTRILLNYGPPTEIWIRPFPQDDPDHRYSESAYPFPFVLIYPNQGFAVEFIGRVKENGKDLIGCPNVSYIAIASWNPEKKPSFEEIASYFHGGDSLQSGNLIFFRQLQEATTLSISSFYDKFKSSDATDCVSTPESLWPDFIQ